MTDLPAWAALPQRTTLGRIALGRIALGRIALGRIALGRIAGVIAGGHL